MAHCPAMADSAYSTVRKGKLKLKGTKAAKAASDRAEPESKGKATPRDEDRLKKGDSSPEEGEAAEWKPMTEEEARRIVDSIPGLTATQRRLEVLRIKQEHMLHKDKVATSHRQKVKKLNENLAALPMHFDIPRVAAAGLG